MSTFTVSLNLRQIGQDPQATVESLRWDPSAKARHLAERLVARFKYTVSARADGDHLIVRAAETSRMAINQILVEEGLPEISSLDDEDA